MRYHNNRTITVAIQKHYLPINARAKVRQCLELLRREISVACNLGGIVLEASWWLHEL